MVHQRDVYVGPFYGDGNIYVGVGLQCIMLKATQNIQSPTNLYELYKYIHIYLNI